MKLDKKKISHYVYEMIYKNAIGTVLSVVASLLLLISLYQKGAGNGNRLLELSGFVTLAIALLYQFWLYKNKGNANK